MCFLKSLAGERLVSINVPLQLYTEISEKVGQLGRWVVMEDFMKEGKVIRAWQLNCVSRRGADPLRSSRGPEVDGGVYSRVTKVVVVGSLSRV